MSRETGSKPQFDRIIGNLERAKKLWEEGNRESAERLLKLAGSIAFAEASERNETDPVPETSEGF
jgi:hypothetical protein